MDTTGGADSSALLAVKLSLTCRPMAAARSTSLGMSGDSGTFLSLSTGALLETF